MLRQTKQIFWVIMTVATLAACGSDSESTAEEYAGSAESYSLSVTVSGFGGSTLVLQNNGGDDLTISDNGVYTFATSTEAGQPYAVTVKAQPTAVEGYCNVMDGRGVIDGIPQDIRVHCVRGYYNIVDTAQSICHDSSTGSPVVCSGRGLDADYQGYLPDYSVSADGKMVYDNVTGLVWMHSPDRDNNGVIDANDKLILPEAQAYCAGLTLDSREWRLPSIKELYSLMNFQGSDPSGYNGNDTTALTPFIDDSVFEVGFGDTSAGERLIDGQYATSTIYVSPFGTIDGAATMFGVNFIDGRIKGYPYDSPALDPKTFYVYCVTGNEEYGNNNFGDNGNQTISDSATGLMWQKDDYYAGDFDDAVDYCESLVSAGYSDWRLPNIKELHSIADYSRAPDLSNSAAIDPLFNATSFSNEVGATDWGYYWSSTTHLKYNGMGDAGAYLAFGRALGYFQMTVSDVHGAGAQRSNHKKNILSQADGSSNVGFGDFYYHGPQGDILRVDNHVRCVRDMVTP